MPKFRTKIHEVEAIQLRHPVTVPSSGSNPSEGAAFEVPAGTWLVVDGEGTQSYVPDDQFSAVYEKIPVPPRRGRPPKAGAQVVAFHKGKRRKHRKRKDEAA